MSACTGAGDPADAGGGAIPDVGGLGAKPRSCLSRPTLVLTTWIA